MKFAEHVKKGTNMLNARQCVMLTPRRSAPLDNTATHCGIGHDATDEAGLNSQVCERSSEMNSEEASELKEARSVLEERAKKWTRALRDNVMARDKFSLLGRTIVVGLRPQEIALVNESVLNRQVLDFAERVAQVLAGMKGAFPPDPISVEPEPNRRPRCFSKGAYILSPGVPEPPDDDS